MKAIDLVEVSRGIYAPDAPQITRQFVAWIVLLSLAGLGFVELQCMLFEAIIAAIR